MTDSLEQIAGSVGGLTWALSVADWEPITDRLQEGQLTNYESKVDPDSELDPDERRRRALMARKRHLQTLRLKDMRAVRAAAQAMLDAEQARKEGRAAGFLADDTDAASVAE